MAMATERAGQREAAADLAMARAALDIFEGPALLVDDDGTIQATNAAWRVVFEVPEHRALPSMSEWIAGLSDGAVLSAALQAASTARGVRTACVCHHGCHEMIRYTARITSVTDPDTLKRTHCVALVATPPTRALVVGDDVQHRLDSLLVRQTLIEERERRRLGRALHDQVTQLLVHVRRRLADARDGRQPHDPGDVVEDIDRVVRLLHELTSNFSPPVLEDLGLLPAMHWLADHVTKSYAASASCDDDGVEPGLTSEVRTIAFRALRELVNNALKHAPGAHIRLRSSVTDSRCRLEICDDGPGFPRFSDHTETDGRPRFPGYGLLSIEQQIRAVGGTFELRIAPGNGTRAIITLDCSGVFHIEGTDDA